MNKLFCVVIALGLVTSTVQGQMAWRDSGIDTLRSLATSIQAEDLRRHLTTLADDAMEGRETGQPGQQRAAQYLADYFQDLGLPAIGDEGGYLQHLSFIKESWEDIRWTVNGQELRHLRDFYAEPTLNTDRPSVTDQSVLFLGYGIDTDAYSDYRGQDVAGQTLLILGGEPRDARGRSLLTGDTTTADWSADLRQKLRTAHQYGAATVIVIDADFRSHVAEVRRTLLNNRLQMGWSENPADQYANSVVVSTETARQLMGAAYPQVVKARERISKKRQPQSARFAASTDLTQRKTVRQLTGSNVLGYVAGSDPRLRDEVLVVTAHYDHIGMRGQEVYNGADDNGSGTSTVLEIAQAFALAQQSGAGPRRSVLFMLVSGEEKGLLGSQYYVEHPVFPLANTIANVNVDMVGRVDEAHADNPNYIYVIGSDRLSTDLHRINEYANSAYTQLQLDYTYNAPNDPNRYYYRSDHYNFAERGIPAIFYFNGTHEDYHRTTDTVDKINFEKMEKIGQLIFYTCWELANRDERIRVDVPQPEDKK